MSQYLTLYPWTLKHPAIVELTPRTRIAYVELLADVAAHPKRITEKYLQHLIRKNHRDVLVEVGLIIDNGDGTYDVIQPDGMYAPLNHVAAEAVAQ